MTAMLLLWVFMGLFAGYASARLYKSFKGADWKINTIMTALLFPGVIFAVFFVLNTLIWGEKSSGAVPFGTMFALVFLWFGISVPLVFIGSYFGFKKRAVEDPVRTNKIPRQIPEQPWYMQPAFSILIGGHPALRRCLHRALLHPYLHLAPPVLLRLWLPLHRVCDPHHHVRGDHHRALLLPALLRGLQLVVARIPHLGLLCHLPLPLRHVLLLHQARVTKLVSGVLYFGYMVIISYSFFVLTGTIGFVACYWFVWTIYSSVRIGLSNLLCVRMMCSIALESESFLSGMASCLLWRIFFTCESAIFIGEPTTVLL